MRLGVGLGVNRLVGHAAGQAAAVIPLRAVASGGEVPANGVYTAQAAGQIKIVCRTRHYIGAQGVTELRVVWGGYYCLTTAGEANHGNDQTLNASIEIPTAPTTTPVRVKFSASNAGTIVNGVAEYISDPLYPSDFGYAGGVIPADTLFWIKDERESPTSGAVVKGRGVSSPTITGEGCYYGATSATSQVDNAGALATTGGWTSRNERFFPLAIIGKTATAQVSVLMTGDSIMTFANDGAGDGVNGGGGFAKRALASVNGHVVPWSTISVPSEKAQNLAASTKRTALYKYFTHAICNYGTNDLGGSRTPTQIQGDLRTIWTALKAAGLQRVEQVLLIIRTTGTNVSADGSDQTYQTGFGPGGNRDTVNTNTVADAGTNGLDAYIDLHTGILTNASDDHKWEANSSTDLTHPNGIKHGTMATAFATRVATWSVT
jgi:hypothetical protein